MRRGLDHKTDNLAIKADTKLLVEAVGGQKKAATFCRADNRRLSEYGLRDTDTFIPADVLGDLLDVAPRTREYPHVVRHLARRAGFALVPLPDVEIDPTMSLNTALADHVRETSDVTTKLCKGLGSACFDPKVARSGIAECDEAIEAVMRVRAVLERIANE